MSDTSANLLRHVQQLVETRRIGSLSDRQLLERFAVQRDEAAFALLVRRHGPMVLSLCRRLLGHEQDAEDAFQAVFLILARKAGAIRQTDVGGFLYRVAYRLALRARGQAVKRLQRERRTETPSGSDPTTDLTWREVRQVVDEELQRLPEEPRSALVLYYLEGRTLEEAAQQLGWSKSTLRRRLHQGRDRLRRRLLARGSAPMAALTASLFAEEAASAMPATLVSATVRAAVAGSASPAIAALVEAGVALGSTCKIKVATVLLLIASFLSGAGVWALHATSGSIVATPQPNAKPEAEKQKPLAQREEGKSSVEVGGRVLDPDGNPVRGARLLFLWRFTELPHQVWATSGADGRFSFAVAQSAAANAGWELSRERDCPYILAAAEGYGFAVTPLDKPEAAANLTLRLVKDDVPIRGRILNLEGKPIAGVRVRINDMEPLNQAQVYVPKNGDLTDWLAALKANKKDPWRIEEDHLIELASSAFDLLFPSVTTAADGRFELRGIGHERMVHVRIEGPTIATQIVNVMTRPGEGIRLPLSRSYPRGEAITYHGATFEILAQPTKPVVGVVRDRDTGKPLAGVTISPNRITNPWNIGNYNQWLIQTTTDKDGRYRLVGLPKGDDNLLMAKTDDLPYLPQSKSVENTPGLGQVTVDFELKRGLWVKGRVTEKITGKPLVGGVGYYTFLDNPHYKDIPREVMIHGRRTREDGSYQFVIVPGRGLISVQVSHNNRYLSGVGAEKIKGPRRKMGSSEGFDTYPFMCQAWNQNAVVEINPKPGEESITCDLVVVPARSMKGTVLGPDGQPLVGARQYRWDTLPGSEFTVWGLPENKLSKPRVIDFVHEGKKLAGFVTVHGDEKEPLQVRLQPWGVVTGRLVTPQGEPLSGVGVSCTPRVGDVFPDKNGRFRIEGLTPGLEHGVYVSKEGLVLPILGGEPGKIIVKPGETLDLGVLKVEVMK